MNAPIAPAASSNHDDPSHTAVLIPLIIAMVLIILGVGIAVTFYLLYRRRCRRWVIDYQARRSREREEAEKLCNEHERGPAWWEVEVAEAEEQDEAETEAGRWREPSSDFEKGWNPVSVTYHTMPLAPLLKDENMKRSISTSEPKLASSTSLSFPDERLSAASPLDKVEMTVLIAMPSPTPTRSRRSSPTSSVPSLDLSSTRRTSSGSKSDDIEDIWEDELPQVQLATVLIPFSEANQQQKTRES